jgi:predicted DNA-binding protein (UPF0251 family)
MSSAKYSKTTGSSRVAVEYVPLAPFREAFERLQEREGLTLGEVAGRMGVDRERVAVLVGAKGAPRKAKTLATGELRTYDCRAQQQASYDVAVRLCRALGLWPVDCGV